VTRPVEFRGVIPILATPFRDDESIDPESWQRLLEFMVGLGVVAGADLNAAVAEASPTALKGEVYSGPFKDQLEVEEPQPGEDVELEPQPGGPQL